MEKVFLYKGENKEFKKLAHISYTLRGLSFIGNSADFCGLQLSERLERKLKLLKFSGKKPRKIVFLHKIISTCTIHTLSDYEKMLHKSSQEKQSKKRYDNTYKKMPKGVTKDNQEAFNRSSGGQHGSYKMFCIKCHFTHKPYKYEIKSKNDTPRYNYEANHCPNCGEDNSYVSLYSSVRVPRKNASKKIWENFYKLFVEPQIKKTK